MGGFRGSNGLMYSDSQRMAMFSRLNCFSGSCYVGDPSLLSDERYKKLIKTKTPIVHGKKRYKLALPTRLTKNEYERLKEMGEIGVETVDPREETIETSSGLYTVYYNSLGVPYVIDKKFHEASGAISSIYSPPFRPLTIASEEFNADTGVYRAVGSKPGYFETVILNTKSIPKHVAKEGVGGIKRLGKLLEESEYADQFLNIGGAELAKDVKPLKDADVSVEDVQGAVSQYAGAIPVPQKWAIEKDAKKEEMMDRKFKEALGEVETKTEVVDETVEPSRLRDFTIEKVVSDEEMPKIVVDELGGAEKKDPRIEQIVSEPGGFVAPAWYEFTPRVDRTSSPIKVVMPKFKEVAIEYSL